MDIQGAAATWMAGPPMEVTMDLHVVEFPTGPLFFSLGVGSVSPRDYMYCTSSHAQKKNTAVTGYRKS